MFVMHVNTKSTFLAGIKSASSTCNSLLPAWPVVSLSRKFPTVKAIFASGFQNQKTRTHKQSKSPQALTTIETVSIWKKDQETDRKWKTPMQRYTKCFFFTNFHLWATYSPTEKKNCWPEALVGNRDKLWFMEPSFSARYIIYNFYKTLLTTTTSSYQEQHWKEIYHLWHMSLASSFYLGQKFLKLISGYDQQRNV